jgi:hypothetical protein
MHFSASQEGKISHYSEYGVRTVHSLNLDEADNMYYI